MKKIGILYGQENTFPQAFIERVNQKAEKGIKAEAVSIEMVQQAKPTDYAVIIDRISQDVPFYRAYLKNAAIGGTAVLNNPFWWSSDEKFFNNALAMHVGVDVPKTVILPSHERPADTDHNSFRNLKFPMDWESIFKYIGFPAYMKPHSGGGWKSVYRLENANELFARHSETGQLVMMLQEEIQFTEYFRCYCLGGNDVRIMQYEPRNPHHLRYVHNAPPVAAAMLEKVRKGVIKLNEALGYDFNTVEFAVRDGVPYAIDFCNPAPDADVNSVGQENFEWVVEHAADMAIARAKTHKDGQMNLTWGTFVANQFGTSKPTSVANSPSSRTSAAVKGKPGPKPKAKTEADATPKVKGKPGPKPRVNVNAEGATITKVKGKPGPKPRAKAEGDVTPKVKGKPGPKPRMKAEGDTAPKVKGKPGPKPRMKAEGDTAPKVKGKPGPKPRMKADGDNTPKVKGKPGPKPRMKAEGDAAPKVKGKRGPKPRVKAEGDTTPKVKGKRGPKPRIKAEGATAPKVKAKRGPKPRTKAEGATAPKVKAKPGPKPRVKVDGAITAKAKGKRGPKPRVKAEGATVTKVKGKRGPKPRLITVAKVSEAKVPEATVEAKPETKSSAPKVVKSVAPKAPIAVLSKAPKSVGAKAVKTDTPKSAAPKAAVLRAQGMKRTMPTKPTSPEKPTEPAKAASTSSKAPVKPKSALSVKATPTAAPTMAKAARKSSIKKEKTPAVGTSAEKVEVKRAMPKGPKKK